MEGISPTADLGSDQFLKLFVEQMKNQDPLEPQKNSEFLAQLAQFTSLEQLGKQTDLLTDQAVNSALTQALQELEVASSLIGKQIEFGASDSSVQKGVVDSVRLKEDGIFFEVAGEDVPVSQLLGIQ